MSPSSPAKDHALLQGLRVVDLAVGMAGALIAKFLAELGATVCRVAPQGGDPFVDLYPAYATWRHFETHDAAAVHSDERLEQLIAQADICLVGGEDFPGLTHRVNARDLAERHRRLIVLNLTGYPDSAPQPGHAVDILVQARAGLVFELRDEKPLLLSYQPTGYGVMLQSLIGLGAALLARERSSHGQVVSVSMLEGAVCWVQAIWAAADKPTPKFLFSPPKRAKPIILKCRSGDFIHIVLGAVGGKYKLYKILGIDDPSIATTDPGLPRPFDPPEKFFGDIELLQRHVVERDRGELLLKLWEAGIVAEPVLAPGECWDEPQVEHNGVLARTEAGVTYVGNPITVKLSPAPRTASPAANSLPLQGIRVVDFGAFVAGPLASVGLSDLGADVVKVEPLEGDPMRGVYRHFAATNRGKRTIAIDMKSAEGVAIAHELCARADVVCSNFRAGAAARLGIDAASLHPKNPATIVLNNAGYGVDGPKARNPAFDPAMQALTGLEVRAGGTGNEPVFDRYTPIDFAGGMLGAASVVFALYRRARSAEGAELTVPLLNLGVFLQSELIRSAAGVFCGAPPLDGDQTGFHPAEKIYQASDGWIAICARGSERAAALGRALGLAEALDRPREQWSAAESALIAKAVHTHSLEDLARKLQQSDVWFEVCRTDGASLALSDAALNARGSIYEVSHPDLGKVRGLGPLYGLSKSRHAARGETPLKGQHTREVLISLDYGAAEIDALYERKIVA